MTKGNLLRNIAKRTGVSQEKCDIVIEAMFKEIEDCLMNDEKIIFQNYLTLETYVRPERMGRHPKTGENTTFPAVKGIKCKVSQHLKDAVNQKEG